MLASGHAPLDGFLSGPSPGTLLSVEPRNSLAQGNNTEGIRLSPLASTLTEILQSFHRPAVALTEDGSVVCSNSAAMRIIDRQPGDDADEVARNPSEWPRRAAFQADGLTLYLAIPDKTVDLALPELKHIPPRLARIARLVIAGCTDKQIATQTGLTFSTVRTYVRQIYRRLDVHTRVELVNTSLARE